MKRLMRSLSKVSDSSPPHSVLGSETSSAVRDGAESNGKSSGTVPKGHLPVYVGEEMKRFVVSASSLNHPIFIELLNKSAAEYGYKQQGVLRIPCHVVVFERVLEALRAGGSGTREMQELLQSLDGDVLV